MVPSNHNADFLRHIFTCYFAFNFDVVTPFLIVVKHKIYNICILISVLTVPSNQTYVDANTFV